MTDNEKATRLIHRIESTLATMQKMTAQALGRLAENDAADLDTIALERVAKDLEGVEWRWSNGETNRIVDQAWPFAPFEAWDMIAQERVTVIGWFDTKHYRLSSGSLARLDSVTTRFPAWFTRIERLAAEHDARDTRNDAFGPAVQ